MTLTDADVGKMVVIDPSKISDPGDRLHKDVIRRPDGKVVAKLLSRRYGGGRRALVELPGPAYVGHGLSGTEWLLFAECIEAVISSPGTEEAPKPYIFCDKQVPPVGAKIVAALAWFPDWGRPLTAEETAIFEPLEKRAAQKIVAVADGTMLGVRFGHIHTKVGAQDLKFLAAWTIWYPSPTVVSPPRQWPHTCPACGSPSLNLFVSAECSKRGCRYHAEYVK